MLKIKIILKNGSLIYLKYDDVVSLNNNFSLIKHLMKLGKDFIETEDIIITIDDISAVIIEK